MKSKIIKRKNLLQERSGLYGKLLFILSMIVTSLVLLKMSYDYLSKPTNLPLNIVEINGDFIHLKEKNLEQQVSSLINDGFFTIDMKILRKEIMKIPWVAEVSIRRVWPDTLQMHIKEHTPLAFWGNLSYISKRSNIFSPREIHLKGNLPIFYAKNEDAEKIVSFYLNFRPVLNKKNLFIKELILNDRQEWKIIFSNNLKLALGRENVNDRITNFTSIYPKLLENFSRFPEQVDMRYEHGFAVLWGVKKLPKSLPLIGDS